MEKIAFTLTLLCKLLSLWFAATACFFWKRPKAHKRRKPRIRFACLIPARNEETVIGALVQSLKAQHYPARLFDVYVLPNNCDDRTEEIALAAGANVLHCAGPVRCKGDVLRQAMAQLLPMNYDVFCVFDADNIVHRKFLRRMNDAFCTGARVAKGRMLAKNPSASWVSGCYALYYGLNECFYNRSRAVMGLSAKLVGTGFAVHRDILTQMGGWHTETIAEDAEFSAMCAASGERIWYVPEAVTYDEAPCSFRVSLIQRKRWCSGIMSAAEIKLPSLFRALSKSNPLRTVDSIFFLCAPFVQAISPLPALLTILIQLQESPSSCLVTIPLSLAIGFVGMIFLAVVIRHNFDTKDGQAVALQSILMFPIFMASWLPLQVASILHRCTNWKEIRHYGSRDFPAKISAPSSE